MSVFWGRTRVQVVQGDITDQDVDAIVNAANSTLMGGGGVDGAIHGKGGPAILAECKTIREREWPGGLPSGKAVITGGGRLKAKYVIHTVGPVWAGGKGGEAEVLANCYLNSLTLAEKHGVRSVAFPSISTGAYGYPVSEASRVALDAVRRHVDEKGGPEEVVFVLFSEDDLRTFLGVLREFE